MKKNRILVIEDEKDVSENIKELLQEEGYEVITKLNGTDGIKSAKNELPDLIVCDIMMKDINGYQVLKSLSADKETKVIPFIFLTAKVDRDDIRMGMQLGADDYLLKPFRAAELLDAIEVRLKRIESFKSNAVRNQPERKQKYEYGDKIFAKVNTQPVLIKVNEIICITAENQYSSVTLTKGKSFLIRKSVSNWESILPNKQFLRIHRSTIINMEYIVKMGKWSKTSLLVYLQGIEKPFLISKRNSTKFRNIGF